MLIFSVLLALGAASLLPRQDARDKQSNCRCFPGDKCWPSKSEWDQFNRTVGGRLVATIPIASSCHNSQFGPYNSSACSQLRAVWDIPETHYRTSSSPMAPFLANQSCDPFTPPDAQCVLGTYIRYAVNASGPADYQKSIAFAQQHNLRFVIRNTGHDYLGKSTGAGALGIWTHNLKKISILDYHSSEYSGKAMKMEAGVQAFEAYKAAHECGLAVVGGNCPTVGVAGGYSQGGGHGPLASLFGLGADQILEWEVVTGTGQLLTATPHKNSDLYWALSGGGGGTYGVTYTMTVRAHPEPQVVGANLTFTNANISQDHFFSLAKTVISNLPALSDAGAANVWVLTNTTFSLAPLILPLSTRGKFLSLMQPTLAQLNSSRVSYDMHVNEYPSFYEGYQAINGWDVITEYNTGGRFIPRSLMSTKQGMQSLMDSLRFIADNDGVISGVSVNVTRFANSKLNSVNPLWRTTAFDAVVGLPFSTTDWSANRASMRKMTDVIMPKLEQITPGGGAYLNEGDPLQPDFQSTFYGKNYARLNSIKAKYDPQDTFYGPTAVGSDRWVQKNDGRLCAVH